MTLDEWISRFDNEEADKLTQDEQLEIMSMLIELRWRRDEMQEKGADLAIKRYLGNKAHWIEHPHEQGENWEYSMYECSACQQWANDDSNFCPNCGAKMKDAMAE